MATANFIWGDLLHIGMNMAVIDLGEALVYPSHPELAAKGALTPERMQKERDRLRGIGIEPIPKRNFSAEAQDAISTVSGEQLFTRFTTKACPEKQLRGFLLCSWARPIPYHRVKGLKSIDSFGGFQRRWEATRASAL